MTLNTVKTVRVNASVVIGPDEDANKREGCP